MTNIVEDSVGDVRLSKVVQHWWELALVPALGDGSSDVEVSPRCGEEVLALADTRRDVMFKSASVGANSGSLSNGIIPDQWTSTMVGTSSVVVVEDCSLIL